MEIKKLYIDIAIVSIFLLLILQFALLHVKSNQCLANPFVYGAQKITTEDNNILCSCSIIDPNVPYAPFTFDKKSLQVKADPIIVEESTGYSPRSLG